LRKLLLILYSIVRWIVIIVIFLSLLLSIVIEKPSVAFRFLSIPLQEQGITYQSMSGGFLSGFKLIGVNYQNKIKAKEVSLKVDWDRLEERVLYIDHLKLDEVEIDRDYLKSLIDSSSSDSNSSDSNSSLPFDIVVLNDTDITLKEIIYDKYKINSAKLHINHFTTDMQKRYRGDIKVQLDSNITKLNLDATIRDDFVKIDSDVEIERKFIEPYLVDSNITLTNNPKFRLKADGTLKKVNYNLAINQLGIKQNSYSINSKRLLLIGDYSQDKNINANLDTILDGNMGDIKLKGDTHLNLDDLNSTLRFNIDSDIEANREFLEPYLVDSNITLTNNPKFRLKADGTLKKVNYKLAINQLGIKQNSYSINSKKLLLIGDYSQDKNINANLDTILDGNMGHIRLKGDTHLNLDDLNNTLKFNIDGDIGADRGFLAPYLTDRNITLITNPQFIIKASGDMQKLKYSLITKQLSLKQNSYIIKSKRLIVNGGYSIIKQDIDAKLDTILDSNVAHLKLNGDTKLNLNDINSTLAFNIHSNIVPNRSFLNSQIRDKNISIQKITPIEIEANGNLNRAKFKLDLTHLKIKRNKLQLHIPYMRLKGDINALKGDTSFIVSTDIKSTVGDGHIDNKTSLNFNDINKTLNYSAKIKFTANNRYINPFLKKEKIVITNRPKIDIKLHGGLEKITIKTDAKAHIKQNKIISKLILSTTPIELDIQNHKVKGSLKVISSSKNMGFDIRSRFNGDYTNPKNIETKTQANIKSFNMFGINLNPIVPLKLNIENSSLGAKAIIDSDRIKLYATTSDYDHIKFYIKTRKLYLYKIVKLPSKLDHKFIQLDLRGDATISKQYVNIKGFIYSNKSFKARVDIHNNKSGLKANINTQHLKIIANGNIDKKDIKAQISIDSLKELQKEINKLYTFDEFNIDGSLKLNAKLKGEKVWVEGGSPKLKLNGFNIEGLDIDVNYANNVVTLNRFNLKTTGFKDKKLNTKIYLNKKGKIYLGEHKKIDIDIHPNIRIRANGDSNRVDGKVTIKKLPIGHPDYGSMILSCDIDYKQRGLDKIITGNILMKKMKLFYEAKFLDIDYDPDVVIVRKEDKNKKAQEDNSFLKHTKIDISIKAPQAEYKTPNIGLRFDINLRAYKEFGKDLGLLGKIEDINGHFDQAPKRFEIEYSNIVFKGGKEINPLLDIRVKYELPQVIIYIDIGGDAKRPKLEFSSEPPMPKKDIMSYLLLGVSTNSLSNGEGSVSREAELFIINQAARDLAYEFDLDRVFVKDDGTGEGYAIEVGKKISKKNMVIIESSKQGNSFILEHDINRNIKVRVGQHQKEYPSQSIDIYFRKKFK